MPYYPSPAFAVQYPPAAAWRSVETAQPSALLSAPGRESAAPYYVLCGDGHADAHSSDALDVHVAKASARDGVVTLGLYIGARGEIAADTGAHRARAAASEASEASAAPQLPPTTSTVLDALDGAECAWPLPASARTESVRDARTDVR